MEQVLHVQYVYASYRQMKTKTLFHLSINERQRDLNIFSPSILKVICQVIGVRM